MLWGKKIHFLREMSKCAKVRQNFPEIMRSKTAAVNGHGHIKLWVTKVVTSKIPNTGP